MKNNNEKRNGKGVVAHLVKANLLGKVLVGVIILIILVALVLGYRRIALSESQTIKIGFEDIGELATQASYCTQINVTDSSQKFLDFDIPFTDSKYIYSYGVNIKAGYDFNEIEWKVKGKTIEVKLPEAKILSSEIDQDSFKVYYENESIFNPITLKENNDALIQLKENAEEEAVNNGLLDNARTNAELIIEGFFGREYDMDEYEIVFKDK